VELLVLASEEADVARLTVGAREEVPGTEAREGEGSVGAPAARRRWRRGKPRVRDGGREEVEQGEAKGPHVNLCLVLFAILCGLLIRCRSGGDDDGDSSSSVASGSMTSANGGRQYASLALHSGEFVGPPHRTVDGRNDSKSNAKRSMRT
jgi:hypothetical protein